MLKYSIAFGVLLFQSQAHATLPYLEDFQFLPEVATVLYGSPTDQYKLMYQFFGRDESNITGRFCEIDDNGKPFSCVSVKPDLKSKTCTLSSYDENDFPLSPFKLAGGDHKQILFHNGIVGKERDHVSDVLKKVKLGDKGSKRTVGVPAPKVIPYIENIAEARDEWWKNIAQTDAESVYRAKLACNGFFNHAGVLTRMNFERKANGTFCNAYNESAARMGSKPKACALEIGKSRSRMTPASH